MIDEPAQVKRLHKRFPKTCKIDFRARHQTYTGISVDFSINGLLIKTDTLFAPESVLHITVHLPDGTVSNLIGKVRRVRRVPGPAAGPGQTFTGDMGIEITERDGNYMKFFMSLLSTTKL